MKNAKVVVPLVLALALGAVLLLKRAPRREAPVAASAAAAASAAPLPRFVDVGADKCTSCKAMKPILAELAREYEGRVRVDFVDAWANREAAEPFKIRMIPTQIFFDAAGRELWRHEGFLSKEQIVTRWSELGMLAGR